MVMKFNNLGLAVGVALRTYREFFYEKFCYSLTL